MDKLLKKLINIIDDVDNIKDDLNKLYCELYDLNEENNLLESEDKYKIKNDKIYHEGNIVSNKEIIKRLNLYNRKGG